MEADRDAPVFAEGAVRVAVGQVWDVVSRIDRYPDWNRDIKAVSVPGPVVEGTTFRWKSGPGTITSTIREVVSPT